MKSWQRYILAFILSFTLIVFLRRVIPCDDIKDGNLLVNLVLASFLTGCLLLYIICIICIIEDLKINRLFTKE